MLPNILKPRPRNRASPVRTPANVHTCRDLHWLVPLKGQKYAMRQTAGDGYGPHGVFEHFTAPCAGPAVHANDRADTTYLVLEGEARFTVGDEIFDVQTGATVSVPQGVSHGWFNSGRFVCRMIVIQNPESAGDFLRHGQSPKPYPASERSWV